MSDRTLYRYDNDDWEPVYDDDISNYNAGFGRMVPVEPDYEAAAKAWTEVIPFYLTWDHLDEREKDAHRKWAKIVVEAALRLGADNKGDNE